MQFDCLVPENIAEHTNKSPSPTKSIGARKDYTLVSNNLLRISDFTYLEASSVQ